MELRMAAAALLLVLPLFASAQKSAKTARIAVVALTTPQGQYVPALKQALAALGHVEGRNIVIDEYWSRGDATKLAQNAVAAVESKPDVIVAIATPAIRAVQKHTSTIPIVMAPATDPVGSGFVKSLARPGGNITGMGNQVIDLSSKTITLLRELLPRAKQVAVLRTDNPTHAAQIREVQDAAAAHGMEISPVVVTSPEEITKAFAAFRKSSPHALIVLGDPFLVSQRAAIAEQAVKQRLPDAYQLKEHVVAGGLISYGPNLSDLFKRAAFYVDRILKGARPADLPVEQPTTFELFVNRKTARALGLVLPSELLVRADQVIE